MPSVYELTGLSAFLEECQHELSAIVAPNPYWLIWGAVGLKRSTKRLPMIAQLLPARKDESKRDRGWWQKQLEQILLNA
jgi:hypothetical protein